MLGEAGSCNNTGSEEVMSHSGQSAPEAKHDDVAQRRLVSLSPTSQTTSLPKKNDRENRIKMYRERRENEERERRLNALRMAEEREERSRQMKEVEKARRANELRKRELQRRQAFEERRRHIEETERQKRQQLLEKVMGLKAGVGPSTAGTNACQSRPATAYAFGSSGPRTLAYLEKLDSRYRVYDSKLYGGTSQELSTPRTKTASAASTGRLRASAPLSSRADREGSGMMSSSVYQGSSRDRRIPFRLSTSPAASGVMTASFAAGESSRSSPNVRSKGMTVASARRREPNLVSQSATKPPIRDLVKEASRQTSSTPAVRKALQEPRKRAVTAGQGDRAVVSVTASNGSSRQVRKAAPHRVDRSNGNHKQQLSPQEGSGVMSSEGATESPVVIVVTPEPGGKETVETEPSCENITQTGEPVRPVLFEKNEAGTEKQQQPTWVKDEPPAAVSSPVAVSYKSGSNKVLTEEEAKAALGERRRIAREQMEREKELERQREEERQRLEEERLRKEEEELRLAEEEESRQLEIARRNEELRLQLAVEMEDKRRENAARELAEATLRVKIKKAEIELKVREQADRMEQERREIEEKRLREEKERVERKKKLEAIMQRTRTSNAAEALSKTDSLLPSHNHDENAGKMSKSLFLDSKEVSSSEASPRFLSTMLQKLADSRPAVGRSLENMLNRVRSSASLEASNNINNNLTIGNYLKENNRTKQTTPCSGSDDKQSKSSAAEHLSSDEMFSVNGDECSSRIAIVLELALVDALFLFQFLWNHPIIPLFRTISSSPRYLLELLCLFLCELIISSDICFYSERAALSTSASIVPEHAIAVKPEGIADAVTAEKSQSQT
ncbi:hypothetical protein M514_00893, partial [Trichuris suis]